MIQVEIQESYRNMGYKIARGPEGARLRVRGGAAGRTSNPFGVRSAAEPTARACRSWALLTPNVWAGGQSFHSVQEWVSLEWMARATETTLMLLGVWVERSA